MSGFPTGSGGFYFPENHDFPAKLYSIPVHYKTNVDSDITYDQIIPFPRLG